MAFGPNYILLMEMQGGELSFNDKRLSLGKDKGWGFDRWLYLV